MAGYRLRPPRRPTRPANINTPLPHLDTRLVDGKVQPFDFGRSSNRKFRPPVGLTHAQYRVHDYLEHRADECGWCCPSVVAIAVACEMHEETARACLRHLVVAKWIKRLPRRDRRANYEYVLLRPPCRGLEETRRGDHPAFVAMKARLRAEVPPEMFDRVYHEAVSVSKDYQSRGWDVGPAYTQATEDVLTARRRGGRAS